MTEERQQNLTLKAWESFVVNGEIPPEGWVKPEILESWKRSKEAGLNYQTLNLKKLTFDELTKRRIAKRKLMETAVPFLDYIYEFIKGSHSIISVNDEEGYILELRGDEEVLDMTSSNDFLGVCLSEHCLGTNSAGLALELDKPIQVIGEEHFNINFHSFTCNSSPIRDPDGKLFGIITILGPKEYMTSHTLGMVATAGQAIEKQILLLKQSEEIVEKNIIEKEIEVAAHIQKSLLPRHDIAPQSVDVYYEQIPTQVVAGDFYDRFRIGEKMWALSLGDVSGQGLRTVIMATMVRSVLRAVINYEKSPARAMKAVNRILARDFQEAGIFSTLIVMTLDGETRIGTYSNAGHPPSFIIKKDGTVKEFNIKGMALGISDNTDYEEEKVKLEQGDVIVHYTDGIIGSKLKDGSRFGINRLKNIVKENRFRTAREIHGCVMAEWLKSSASKVPADDITLIIAKF